ncbi:phenoloxidase-activating factor 2 [Arctopsyche grandis]|uniref:phenoloxidase-activating factor 2 n=1 Tax=Arctopsyche grandis TaxID=121162 RepID=UPI00406D930B
MFKLKFFTFLTILSCIFAQEIDDELQKAILDVFGPNPNAPTVTPTTAPTTIITDDGTSCICVPYYLCDADSRTIISDPTATGETLIDIRFDKDSCQESVEVCCKEAREATNPIPPVVVPSKPQGCGIRNENGVDFQITGDLAGEAQFAEFPWTVAILSKADSSALCAGSLIHPQVVLTASHCISKHRVTQIKIRVGEWDTQTVKERFPYQERDVARIVTHPNFNAKTLANDIGLLFLSKPVEIAENINTICLPSQNFNMDTSKDCYATGWGKSNFGQQGRYAVIMKKVKLDTVPYATCQSQLQKTRLGPRFRLDQTFICAGGKAGVDTCQGDGGAPLVCPTGKGRYHQAGVVAWGIGCGEKDVPGVYGYIAKLRNWIDENVKQAGYDTSYYTSP